MFELIEGPHSAITWLAGGFDVTKGTLDVHRMQWHFFTSQCDGRKFSETGHTAFQSLETWGATKMLSKCMLTTSLCVCGALEAPLRIYSAR